MNHIWDFQKTSASKHVSFYLCGQTLASSSEGFRIRSTKVLLEVFVWRGGGLLSMLQNLILANPCASSGPRFENCNECIIIMQQNEINIRSIPCTKLAKKHILEENILESLHELLLVAWRWPAQQQKNLLIIDKANWNYKKLKG